MTISVICAWLAVLFLLFTAGLYIAKRFRLVRRPFRRFHIAAGHLLMLFGLIHGILAGNAPGTSLLDASFGSELFSLNMGTCCLILAFLLGLSYKMHKVLKKNWIRIHRVLTVCILVVMVIHVAQMGITLPQVLSGKSAVSSSEAVAVMETETSEEVMNETEAVTETEAAEETTAEAENESSEEVATEMETVTKEVAETLSSVQFSGATLKDGVYEGSAKGYKSTIAVQVTVTGGAVTDIEITDENDTPKFFRRVTGLPDTIIEEQSLDVDTVSGATFSSRGILNAVYDALQDAVVDGTLETNN